MKKTTRIHLATCLVTAVLTVAIYWPTLDHDFVFDDAQNIQNNALIKIDSLSWSNLKAAGFDSFSYRRPIANWSFALNHLAHGLERPGYRLVNIAIHIVNGWLAYWFVFQLLIVNSYSRKTGKSEPDTPESRPASGRRHAAWLAAATAIVWIVHPVHVNAVTYIVQRMVSMTTMFMLASLCLYMYGRREGSICRRRIAWATALICWLLALGTKEIAITLPVLVFMVEWFFFRNLSTSYLVRNLKFWLIPAAITAGIALVYLKMNPIEHLTAAYELRDFTMSERMMTQFRVVIFYLTLIILPSPERLTLDHHIVTSTSLIAPITTLLSVLAVIGVLALAVYLAKQHRLLAFCILWYFINLAVESSIIAIEMAYEHRLYLPMLLVILLIIVLLDRLRPPLIVGGAVTAIVAALLIFSTVQRNKVWETTFTLWQDCVLKAPNKARPRYNLGNAYFEEGMKLRLKGADGTGQFRNAIKRFEETLRIQENYEDAMCNLGVSHAELDEHDQSIAAFARCVSYYPENVKAIIGIAAELRDKADKKKKQDPERGELFAAAYGHLQQALKLAPYHSTANDHIAYIYTKRGDNTAAIDAWRNSVSRLPKADRLANLGLLLTQAGEYREAIEMLERARTIDPDYQQAYVSLDYLCNTYARQVEPGAARAEVYRLGLMAQKNILRLNPKNAAAGVKIDAQLKLIDTEMRHGQGE